MVTVEYSSNNSGGDWWLTDEHWKALEAAGWSVRWVKDDPFFQRDGVGERWLGALATRATLECASLDEAIASWSSVTGLDPDAAGCRCCGEPHYFGVSA